MNTLRRIHLIRHGETDWNRDKRCQGQSDSSLTDQGRKQAARLAEELVNHEISYVYCSSSLRTRQTAEILFRDALVDIEYCDSLREIYLGSWEGSLHAEIKERHPEAFSWFWQEPHNFQLDGAEDFIRVQQRGVERLMRIVRECPAQEAAIVSHGVLIKAVLCHIEERHLSRLWEPPVMHNCAHSIVEVRDGEPLRIIQYADQLVAESNQT